INDRPELETSKENRVKSLIVVAMVFFQLLPFRLAAQTGKPTSIAELATYTGADREQMLAAGAKKEGKIVWYTALAGNSYRELAKAFEAKYGVQVESYRGTRDLKIVV